MFYIQVIWMSSNATCASTKAQVIESMEATFWYRHKEIKKDPKKDPTAYLTNPTAILKMYPRFADCENGRLVTFHLVILYYYTSFIVFIF